MRILIVGGTSFVGSRNRLGRIERRSRRHGHQPRTDAERPSRVRHPTRSATATATCRALEGLTFDVTVDAIAFRPIDVDALATALEHRGGHHIQISSVSAYEDPPSEGATEETATLWNDTSLARDAEVTGRVLRAAEGGLRTSGRGALRRPAHHRAADLRHRQPRRHAALPLLGRAAPTIGGNVAVPGPRDNALQYIDARDLGEFVVTLATNGTLGAFHAAGPYPPGRFFEVIESIKRTDLAQRDAPRRDLPSSHQEPPPRHEIPALVRFDERNRAGRRPRQGGRGRSDVPRPQRERRGRRRMVGRPRGPVVVAHARARGHARSNQRVSRGFTLKIAVSAGKFR